MRGRTHKQHPRGDEGALQATNLRKTGRQGQLTNQHAKPSLPIHPQRLSTLFIKWSGLRNLVWANLHKTVFPSQLTLHATRPCQTESPRPCAAGPTSSIHEVMRAHSKRQTSAKKAVNETTRQPIIENRALPTLRQIQPCQSTHKGSIHYS